MGYNQLNLAHPAWKYGATAAMLAAPQLFKKPSSYTRTYSMVGRKSMRRRTNKSFKKQVFDTQPARHFTGEDSESSTHNTLLTVIPTQGIAQGSTNVSRQGDSIYICALKLKYNFQSNVASNGYQWRILVGWTGEEITTAGVATGFVSGLGASEIFLPTTTSNWVANGIVNPKTFTCLYDQTIDINSQVTGASDLAGDSTTVRINQAFDYQSSGSVMGKTKNLAIVVVGCVVGGVSGATSVGNVVAAWDVIYKS